MSLINSFQIQKKRISDDTLLKLQRLLNEELDRRSTNDKNNSYKGL